jgi:hypothetical protein
MVAATTGASVTVTYIPPIEQVFSTLSSSVQGVGSGTSLADKVAAAHAAYEAGQKATACGDLHAFIDEVQAQSGKKKITTAEGQSLIAQAQELQQLIGC